MLSQARLIGIGEKYSKNEIDYPWDLHQAIAIADLVTFARDHLNEKYCEDLAYDIAMIVGISHTDQREKRKAAG